jgi:hypothetical protein
MLYKETPEGNVQITQSYFDGESAGIKIQLVKSLEDAIEAHNEPTDLWLLVAEGSTDLIDNQEYRNDCYRIIPQTKRNKEYCQIYRNVSIPTLLAQGARSISKAYGCIEWTVSED